MNKLKEKRIKRNISRMELAIAVGVGARYIGFIEENKRNPSLDIAYRIARKLETSIEEIFFA